MKKRKLISVIIAIVTCMALCLTGCNSGGNQNASGGKAPSEVLVLTVGEDEVYLNEVNYYALSMIQGMGVPAGTDMSQYYSEDYPTMDDAFKAQLLAQIRQSKILYLKAVEQGYTLTEEELTEMDGLVDEFIAISDATMLAEYGIDKEVLTDIYTQIGLIRKMENALAEEIEVDKVSYGTTENLVFLTIEIDANGNAKLDAEGNYIYLSEEKQAEQKANAEAALERVKNGELVEDLIEEYDLAATSGTSHSTTDSLRETYNLSNGEVSDIIESDFGYTIVKMVALEDDEYTDMVGSYNSSAAVQDAIETQENEWFSEFPIKEDDLKQEVWDAFTFQDFL